MGPIEQATGSTRNGLIIMAALLLVACAVAPALRQGQER